MAEKEITLLDVIDRAQLQSLQDAFAKATGMAALATDKRNYRYFLYSLYIFIGINVNFLCYCTELVKIRFFGKHLSAYKRAELFAVYYYNLDMRLMRSVIVPFLDKHYDSVKREHLI